MQDAEDAPMLGTRHYPKYDVQLTWGAAATWLLVAGTVVFLVLFIVKGGGDSAEDIIARYKLTGHDLIGGGHFREIVRTGNMTVIYYLQQHHDTTLHRLYNGTAEETIVWIEGTDAQIDDNGKIVSLGQHAPSYVVEHDGSNWLDYNVQSGWSLMTVTFVPPFDLAKLSM
jgi:predicted cupin superfamily sugar epimerase